MLLLWSRIGCTGLALEPPSVMLPLRHMEGGLHSCSRRGNWSALGHSVSQDVKTRDSTRGSILSHEGHFQHFHTELRAIYNLCPFSETCCKVAGFVTFIEYLTAYPVDFLQTGGGQSRQGFIVKF